MLTLFDQARALHQAGDLDAAIATYRQVADDDPDAFRAQNNLGVVLEATGGFAAAIEAYRKAIALAPDQAISHYNLGHVMQRQGRHATAIECYQRCLALDPGYVPARYNWGHALSELGRLDEAVIVYRDVLARYTQSGQEDIFKVASNLGLVLLELHHFHDAAAAFRDAIAMNPNSAEDYANLANVLYCLHEMDEARAAYDQALAIKPNLKAAREGLARMHLRLQQPGLAADVYRELLKLQPDDPFARHMLAALGGDKLPTRASDAYVEAAFDLFADSFDNVLHRLHYRAPELLRTIVGTAAEPNKAIDVLDAGCGTGLCGSWLKPYARRLDGVDLSARMLEKARSRCCYDGLIKEELTAYMLRNPLSYELIVSSDTLVYFGALEAVLYAASGALRTEGLLAFSVERLVDGDEAPQRDYRLNPHGRYSHAESYLRSVLSDAGLKVVTLSGDTLRLEEGEPVAGWLVLAKKPEII